MTITYQFICSRCKRVFPVVNTDPGRAPVCCGEKMDAIPDEQ